MKLTMTLAAAARYLNASRATLIFYVSTGDLCAMLINGRLLFHQPHLDSLVKEQAEKQAAEIRRAREATPQPHGPEQPAVPGAPRSKRSSSAGKYKPEQVPRPGVATANPAAGDPAGQQELPGLEPASPHTEEPR
jgi:hypothetical protein